MKKERKQEGKVVVTSCQYVKLKRHLKLDKPLDKRKITQCAE